MIIEVPIRRVNVRTVADDSQNVLQQYQDLLKSGKSNPAVIISEDAAGTVTVLGQMLRPNEMLELLTIAARALEQFDKDRTALKLETHLEPMRRGAHNRAARRAPKITINAGGNLVPPQGENFISCGECNHPRWYVLLHNQTDKAARYACAHCGNELESITILHPEGTA